MFWFTMPIVSSFDVITSIYFWLLFTEFLPKRSRKEMNDKCITIPDKALVNLNSQNYLEKHDFRVPWDLLLEMKLSFSITTKTLKKLGPISGPECFKFRIDINFVNDDHDGQVIFTFFFYIFLEVYFWVVKYFALYHSPLHGFGLNSSSAWVFETEFLKVWIQNIFRMNGVATIDMLTTPKT